MEGVLAVMTGQDLVEPGNQMLGSGEGAMALKDVVPMVMSQGKVLFHSGGGCCGRNLARARRPSRASGGGGVRRASGCHRRA